MDQFDVHTSGALQLNKVMMFGSDYGDAKWGWKQRNDQKKIEGVIKKDQSVCVKVQEVSPLRNVFKYS